MRGRAQTVVDAVRVGHVRLVIRRVEVYTIPASREKHLSPEAIWAVGVADVWGLRHRRTIEVDAGRSFRSRINRIGSERDLPEPGDGLGCRGASVTPGFGVSGEYAKAVWKGLHSLVGSVALEIVATILIRGSSLLYVL